MVRYPWMGALVLGVALSATVGVAEEKVIVGRATVVDGDELSVAGQRILLYAIRAPGISDKCRVGAMPWLCGANSAKTLRELVGESPVRCEPRERDRAKTVLAVCFAGNIELNREMVRQGMALADRRVLTDYLFEENEAKAQRRGLWQGGGNPG